MNNKVEKEETTNKKMQKNTEEKIDKNRSEETINIKTIDSGFEISNDIETYGNFIHEDYAEKDKKIDKSLSMKLDTLVDITNSQKKSTNVDEQSYIEEESAYIDEFAFLEGRRVGKYRVTKSLGSGSSSRVKLGVNLESGEKVAIKIVKREFDNSENKKKREDRIYREVLISSLLSHPHIVRLKNFYFNENYFYLVFEYVKGVQLLDIVIEKGALHENEARRYFRQILSAISYIHENCIVHRDLKIENILIDEFGNVKILDFGLSNFFDYRRFLSTFCGSLYFAAPELLSGMRYIGPEIDVWSLGIILYVLLNGKVPFDDKNLHNLHIKIKEAKLELQNNLTKEANDLLAGMINNNTGLRYDLGTIIESPWVNQNYQSKIDNFMTERKPILSVDENLVVILGIIAKDQFPMLKSEIQKYIEATKDKTNGYEKEFWANKPSIALYYLLQENFEHNSGNMSIYQNQEIKEAKDERPESMHNFVNFLFAKEKENIFSKYFLGSVFVKTDSSPFLPEKTISLKDEFEKNRNECVINVPRIKKSFIKGIFNGINVRNLSCQYHLRKNLQNCFMMNNIVFEILDRHYVCSKGRGNDFCSFKVSLYKNLIFGNFYLSVTRIVGNKAKYNMFLKMLEDMAKKGENYV